MKLRAIQISECSFFSSNIILKVNTNILLSTNRLQSIFIHRLPRCVLNTHTKFETLQSSSLENVLLFIIMLYCAQKQNRCIKGRVMGPMFVLVCPWFRENVIVTCKIVSFLFSLDNFHLKNVIVFIFENQISKWRSSKKGLFLKYFSTFFSHRKKTQKFFQHISH